jgi:hypothetical protein
VIYRKSLSCTGLSKPNVAITRAYSSGGKSLFMRIFVKAFPGAALNNIKDKTKKRPNTGTNCNKRLKI